ncbi:GNAT family N-acetyltransferase [Micromonospora sp. NPDC053811]|uniref:GNAT family N-acetyltransferase n=1 Tax=Micromonospora sp. NPDC053811 TaxID=3154956 RepID=UPI00343E92B1
MGERAQSIKIVRAREEHLLGIMELAESRSLAGADAATLGRDGFLVSNYGEDTYRDRLTTAEHFYVAVEGDSLVGFLLAYSDQRIGPDEWLNHRIKVALGSFLVIKQVCVAREAARQGIASQLYHHVMEQWTTSPVVAAVVAEPANHASTAFHRRLGFEKLAELRPPDRRLRTVWVWRRADEALLQSQYAVAVDLYKHEDGTNWHKLNNFFYITAALAAATGFAFSNAQGSAVSQSNHLALVISIIGLGVSLAFFQMLRWGRRYLHSRKDAVIALEEHIAWHGGQRIVSRELDEPGNSWLHRSPTGLVMVLLPLLVAACWIAVLVLALTS